MVTKLIILNELEYAEQCLKDGVINDKPYSVLAILAKYYYHHLGYRKKKIIEEMTEFFSNAYPRYHSNKAAWDASIEKLASNAGKYTLYEIEGVWITENELNTIAEIHNKVLERLVFTMLCLAKLALRKNENSNGWINDDTKTIFSLARVSGSVTDRYIRLNNLYQLGLIELPKRNDVLSYRITFIDDDSKNVLFIHDFRELGYEYLKYKGQNIIRCAECGILVRGNKAGTKRYCSSCAAYTPQETKTIICIDCKNEFKVDARISNKCRCDLCQENYRRKYKSEKEKERRMKMKNTQ